MRITDNYNGNVFSILHSFLAHQRDPQKERDRKAKSPESIKSIMDTVNWFWNESGREMTETVRSAQTYLLDTA